MALGLLLHRARRSLVPLARRTLAFPGCLSLHCSTMVNLSQPAEVSSLVPPANSGEIWRSAALNSQLGHLPPWIAARPWLEFLCSAACHGARPAPCFHDRRPSRGHRAVLLKLGAASARFQCHVPASLLPLTMDAQQLLFFHRAAPASLSHADAFCSLLFPVRSGCGRACLEPPWCSAPRALCVSRRS
ncbi:hypothetical protein Zm00014a_035596 [Zea mays]|uniref:Uncharacterized protein n=1 Tax=Zea mays TaxID=4577 RepID=A0A3L6DIH4_MAIZE|nr:hypothetical protein Zm00014a_035596 [Zea mays]